MKAGAHYLGNNKTKFTVWAPLKKKMTLHIVHPEDRKIPMQPNVSGYFTVEATALPGERYFFIPGDDEIDTPDPASQFQPEGVHGPSQIIDHNAYQWNDKNWRGIPFAELILYELHVGTFTKEGSFESIITKLDHLIETGVSAIQLMPVAQFPGQRNWGYDGVYPYAVQNSYGGPEALKKLVDVCHQKNIAVFLDVVYNHLGPEGNYFAKFAPYFSDAYKTPWGQAINFDGQYSDGVRDYFSDNATFWFEHYHIDGLRFDAIHGIHDAGALHFWQLMHKKIYAAEQKLGRHFYTIAESDLNDPKVIGTFDTGGYQFTAQWLDDFHHALYILLDRERGRKLYADFGEIEQLAKAYKEGFVHSGEYVNFRKRKYGASSSGISGDNFVAFIENHDQAGNRVTGDRLASLVPFEKIKIASAGLLLAPYIPMLFMGEEYGEDTPFLYFVDHSDKDLISAVREGRKKEFEHFGWDSEPADPQDEKTFLQSKLQWHKEAGEKHGLILKWYKYFIHLRKQSPVLKNFDKNDLWMSFMDDMLILYRRSNDQLNYLVTIFNFSETSNANWIVSTIAQSWNKLVDSNDAHWCLSDKQHDETLPDIVHANEQIVIKPLSVVVYENGYLTARR